VSELAAALQDAGGTSAPHERGAQLRALLLDALTAGAVELTRPRSGRDDPVAVAFAVTEAGDALLAATPAPAAVRADPDAAHERAWLLATATVGALFAVAGTAPATTAGDLVLRAGTLGAGHLALAVPAVRADGGDADLAVLAFEEQAAAIARLRACAHALPGHVVESIVEDLRPPMATALRSVETIARLGGRPADPASADEHEEAVLTVLQPQGAGVARPHEDPDPARRAARRIVQRLHGMGKWGGYHTEFSHLARGFEGNDRALAESVGEALLAAGLLAEKRSVGQRHVFLDPRRAADVHALLERGELPPGVRLPP
jgi:hypothetical protein